MSEKSRIQQIADRGFENLANAWRAAQQQITATTDAEQIARILDQLHRDQGAILQATDDAIQAERAKERMND